MIVLDQGSQLISPRSSKEVAIPALGAWWTGWGFLLVGTASNYERSPGHREGEMG